MVSDKEVKTVVSPFAVRENEVKVFDELVFSESLENSNSIWSNDIKMIDKKYKPRKKYSVDIKKSSYNIKNSVVALGKFVVSKILY